MSTAGLTTQQLRRAVRVQQELAEIADPEEFPVRAAKLVRELLAADHAGYNAIDLARRRAVVMTDPHDSVFDGGPELLAQLGHQNPLIAHYLRTSDGRALRLSDFITRRQLHRTDLYDQVYRHIPLEFQLAAALPPSGRGPVGRTEVVGLSAGRRRRDFTAGERRLLEAVRPHLAATLGRLRELALARAIVVAGRDAVGALALVDHADVVAWASPDAAELGIVAGELLPEPLRGVPAGSRAALAVTLHGRPFTALRTADTHAQLDALHLTPTCAGADLAALRAAGLTARQAEVMLLAARGRTTGQIAAALALSPRGVEKHFERIYARLGVRNRTQAVLRSLGQAVADPRPVLAAPEPGVERG